MKLVFVLIVYVRVCVCACLCCNALFNYNTTEQMHEYESFCQIYD